MSGSQDAAPGRGRLAQELPRGGLAPPGAPFVIEHREALGRIRFPALAPGPRGE